MASRKLDENHMRIYCWFLSVIIILGLLAVVAWLSLTPKNPNFSISEPHFPSLGSQNSTLSNPNSPLIFDLEISNPNKRMGIYYSNISLQLLSGGLVGKNSTPDFYQGHKNTTSFQIIIHADEGFWRRANSGSLDFTVRVETAVRFRIIKWKTKLRRIEYEADFSNVKNSLNGTVSGGNYTELYNAPKVNTRK